MVIDSMDALSGKPTQITPRQGEQRLFREDLAVMLRVNRIVRIEFLVGGVIKSMRQLVDLVDRGASFSQTIVNRSDWEGSLMLTPIEALLSGGGDHFSIDDKRRRGIVTL
jgi:hypothetical protein